MRYIAGNHPGNVSGIVRVYSLICLILFSACSTSITNNGVQSVAPREPNVDLEPKITAIPIPPIPDADDSAQCVPQNTKREVGDVVYVVDGNTFDVRMEDGSIKRVRYVGIGTPGEYHPLFQESKEINKRQVLGEVVTLVGDYIDIDDDGNLLRYVFVDDSFINYELVAAGYAFTSDSSACEEDFINWETGAAEGDKGFWGSFVIDGHPLYDYSPITPTDTVLPTETLLPTVTSSPTVFSTPTLTLPPIQPARCVPTGTKREVGIVVSVIDGDTIDVRLEDGLSYRVRYIGMNTPERNQVCGPQATNKNSELVADKWVTLVKDVSETDRYDRLLRYVFVNDIFVNEELVRQGYATTTTYPPDVACETVFLEAERLARNNELGCWVSAPTIRPTSPPPPPAKPTKTPKSGGNCHPSYPDVCIPPPPPDLDCKDIPFRRFRVVGSDPHRFDGDHDGIGCES